MKSHKHLFPQVCAVGNVLAAARAAMQGKMSEASAARFHTRWETHAVQLAEELASGNFPPSHRCGAVCPGLEADWHGPPEREGTSQESGVRAIYDQKAGQTRGGIRLRI